MNDMLIRNGDKIMLSPPGRQAALDETKVPLSASVPKYLADFVRSKEPGYFSQLVICELMNIYESEMERLRSLEAEEYDPWVAKAICSVISDPLLATGDLYKKVFYELKNWDLGEKAFEYQRFKRVLNELVDKREVTRETTKRGTYYRKRHARTTGR